MNHRVDGAERDQTSAMPARNYCIHKKLLIYTYMTSETFTHQTVTFVC